MAGAPSHKELLAIALAIVLAEVEKVVVKGGFETKENYKARLKEEKEKVRAKFRAKQGVVEPAQTSDELAEKLFTKELLKEVHDFMAMMKTVVNPEAMFLPPAVAVHHRRQEVRGGQGALHVVDGQQGPPAAALHHRLHHLLLAGHVHVQRGLPPAW